MEVMNGLPGAGLSVVFSWALEQLICNANKPARAALPANTFNIFFMVIYYLFLNTGGVSLRRYYNKRLLF
jgi:hypothetical protein